MVCKKWKPRGKIAQMLLFQSSGNVMVINYVYLGINFASDVSPKMRNKNRPKWYNYCIEIEQLRSFDLGRIQREIFEFTLRLCRSRNLSTVRDINEKSRGDVITVFFSHKRT